jgi:hypothetical protein
MSDEESQAPAAGSELPRLYTLKEVREATQYGTEKLRRVLLNHPEVPRIGKGRGTRLTYEAYMQLLEALRQPAPSPVGMLPDGRLGTREEIARFKFDQRRRRKSNLDKLRRELLGKV